MHPELEHAIESRLSIPEVIEIFAKHHSGSVEEYIRGDFEDFERMVPSDNSFWDNWKPLSLRLGQALFWDKLEPVPDLYLSIYKDLTRVIISWICDSERKGNVYLIAEPQEIAEPRYPPYMMGIPSRARVLATICCYADRLGAQSTVDLDAISGELAARYPAYRRILAGLLIDNPGFLELPTRTRFKKLILEPWKALQESHPQYIDAPPVIVLRWYSDYCDQDLLYSICEFSSSPHSSSLLWIISIDRNVKLPVRDLLDPFVQFRFIQLPVRYDDGPSDAALVLHHQFGGLRRNYEATFARDEKWPSDEQMSNLTRIVSGVLESIDAILDFVDREDGGGPKAHLATFLIFMVDSPSPSDERPYCALDHFYIRAFSNIPPHHRSVVNQVFSIIYYAIYLRGVTPFQIACLLSIGKASLLGVHSYISGWANNGTDLWYIASKWFGGFLMDPKRSGKVRHSLKSGPIAFEALLHFLSYSSNFLEFLKSRLRSIPVDPNAYSELEDLRETVSGLLYGPNTAFHQAFLEHVLTRRFDSRCMAYTSDTTHPWSFMHFLYELWELGKVNSPNIVRVKPVGPLDEQFIYKCQGLAEPWDFESRKRPLSPKYVLLGFEKETVLVLLEDAGRRQTLWNGLRMDIYTSAMLDYM